jgi:hypothetical protein
MGFGFAGAGFAVAGAAATRSTRTTAGRAVPPGRGEKVKASSSARWATPEHASIRRNSRRRESSILLTKPVTLDA